VRPGEETGASKRRKEGTEGSTSARAFIFENDKGKGPKKKGRNALTGAIEGM